MGIFGLGGGVLVIGALILASETIIVPRNDYQLQQLPKSMLTVVAAAGGVIVGLILLRRSRNRSHPVVASSYGRRRETIWIRCSDARRSVISRGHLADGALLRLP